MGSTANEVDLHVARAECLSTRDVAAVERTRERMVFTKSRVSADINRPSYQAAFATQTAP